MNQIAGSSPAEVSAWAGTATTSRQAVARNGHVRHHASGATMPAAATTLSRQRAVQVGRDGELGDGHRERERRERPVEPRRAPHAALPSGRRARRVWPPSRAVAVRSSPP